MSALQLARAVLYLHFAVVLFNVFWLIAVPLGWACGWRFVRNYWWRGAHLAALFVVALQAALGRLCFLTIWQNELDALAPAEGPAPVLDRLVIKAVFWPLPMWVFVMLYLAALAWALALWRLVPPQRHAR